MKLLAQALVCAALAFAQDPIATDADTPDAVATPSADPNGLTADDVQAVVKAAATALDVKTLVIAVTDRQGNILAVYRKPQAPQTVIGQFGRTVDVNELAVATARTAAFFSHNEAPLSSRTVRFISGVHFPPGISFTGNADLYGIENTNRGCTFNVNFLPGVDFPYARSIDGKGTGLGIQTGKADLKDSDPDAVNPGGIPLYKNGRMVGGVGVAGASNPIVEYAALLGSVGAGFGPTVPPPGAVFVGGLSLPFAEQTTAPNGLPAGVLEGSYLVQPKASPAPVPEGNLIQPRAGSQLTLADVQKIVQNSIDTANTTRGVIRLPLGKKAKMVIAIADLDGSLLALYRMTDSTVFSTDVAVAKARNVIYFTQNPGTDLPGITAGTAVNNRTISFGAQPFFPPGIDYSDPGPFYNLFLKDTANPCTQGAQPPNPNQNGIVFFPGAVPLYKDGKLVGGLGISGDGVDQDDYVTAGGAAGFDAPESIRADKIYINGVRMPYLKFPRNPTY